jgi:hypothetical protein
LKLSPWFIFLINGPFTNDNALPPAGFTQLIAVLLMISLLVDVVFINPFVNNRLPETSAVPFALSVRPASLLISKL